MNEHRGSRNGRADTRSYEIRLQGRLDERWAAWFDGMSLAHPTDGTTVLVGAVADQAALHGVLQKLRDLGVTLISVTQLPHPQHSSESSPTRERRIQ